MRWLLLLPLLVLCVLFGLSNQQPATLTLWPTDLAWTGPLYIAVLAIGAVFFLLGALVVWFAGLRHRNRARQMEEAAQVLEAELAEARAEAAKRPVAPPPRTSTATGLVPVAQRSAA